MQTVNSRRAFIDPEYMLYEQLRVNGDPVGSFEMNVATATDFEYVAPMGFTAFIERVNFTGHNTSLLPANFIGITALSVGCSVKVLDEDDKLLLDFLRGTTLKDNTDFGLLAGLDNWIRDTLQIQQDELVIRWTVGRSGNALRLSEGRKIQFKVQDDLSAITKFRAQVQGWLEPLKR